MRIGPTIINGKDNIFKKKKIDGKTLLDVTFNLVNESEKKTSKTEISDIITKQFPPFEEFTIENGYDQMKLLSSMKLMIKCNVMNLPTKISYYQEKGKNYPQWRQQKEIINFKPNPTDYDSDETIESQKEKANYVKAIKKNIYISKSKR